MNANMNTAHMSMSASIDVIALCASHKRMLCGTFGGESRAIPVQSISEWFAFKDNTAKCSTGFDGPSVQSSCKNIENEFAIAKYSECARLSYAAFVGMSLNK